jgi:hypothetical protein
MKRVCAGFFLILMVLLMIPGSLVAQMKPIERISLSVNAVHGLLGEIQADFSVKFDAFELSLKPGLRFGYPREKYGEWVLGPGFPLGYSLRLSFHQYISRSLYLGLVIPAVWSLDVPNPMYDIDYLINLGVAPIFGLRYKLSIFLLTAEVGVGIGGQLVVLENPWAYAIKGWFPVHAELGVGLAFGRRKPPEG